MGKLHGLHIIMLNRGYWRTKEVIWCRNAATTQQPQECFCTKAFTTIYFGISFSTYSPLILKISVILIYGKNLQNLKLRRTEWKETKLCALDKN